MSTSRPITFPPLEVVRLWSKRSGRVLQRRLGGTTFVYLLGAEANAFIAARDELFSVGKAMKALVPVDGPTSVVVSDGPDHTRRRGALRPSLSPKAVETYLDAMRLSATEAVDELLSASADGEPVDAYPVLRGAIRRSTLRALFDPATAADAEDLGRLLQPLLDLVEGLPQVVELHQRLGTPRWRRAMAVRAQLEAYIDDRIAEARQAGPGRMTSSVDHLVHGAEGTGSGLSDQEIRDQAITLIAAGYETTSAAMGWIVYLLGLYPDWQERVRSEVAALGGVDSWSVRDLLRLSDTQAAVTEALRRCTSIRSPSCLSGGWTGAGPSRVGSCRSVAGLTGARVHTWRRRS